MPPSSALPLRKRFHRPVAAGFLVIFGAALVVFSAILVFKGRVTIGRYTFRTGLTPYEDRTAAASDLVPAPIPEGQSIWKDGNPEESITLMTALLAEIRAYRGDYKKISWQRFRLPDGRLAPDEFQRTRIATHVAPTAALTQPTDPQGQERARLYRGVWLTSRLYASLATKKDGSKTMDSSFYLVGYEDGRVEKVPLSRVRVYRLPGTIVKAVPVFPGMAAYKEGKPITGPQ